jgi:hypothetical protein
MKKDVELLAKAVEAKSQLMDKPKSFDIEDMKNDIMQKIKILFQSLDKENEEEACEQISELCNSLLVIGNKHAKFKIYGKKIAQYVSQ